MAKRKAPSAAPPPAKSTTAAAKPQGKRARFSGPPPLAAASAPKPQPKSVKAKAKAAAPKAVPTPPAPTTFTVSAGSYERLLYGLSCSFSSEPSSSTGLPYNLTATPVFSFPAHLSSLKTVAGSLMPSPGTGSERKVGGKYLVSGGTDEVVKVWDLRRRKEVGTLEGDTSGNILTLTFVPSRNMLLCATASSGITLYRVRDWVLLRSLKGHKGRVNCIDAHPQGRVALSVGEDKMLRMWDLVAGKAVATMKLVGGKEGDVVKWNTVGDKFAVICGNTLTVYGIDMSTLHTLVSPSRFHSVQFCHFPLSTEDPTQREYLFVACEDGKTRVFDISVPTATEDEEVKEGEERTLEPVAVLVGHSNRVKQIDLLEVALPPAAASSTSTSSTIVLTSVSSDGFINMYDLALLPTPSSAPSATPAKEISPSASHDTDGSRLTCVNAVGMSERTKKSQREAGVDAVDGEGEGESSEEDSDEEEDDSEEEMMEGEDIGFDSEEELDVEGEEESEDEEEGEEE